MTALSDKYEGNFLEGIDLEEGKRYDLTIEAIAQPGSEKDARGKTIDKAIITFAKAKKRLIVNKTMWEVICAVLGKDDAQWPGNKITVMRRYLPEAFGQKNVPCPRVVPPKGTPIKFATRGRLGSPTPWPEQ